jgi:hypothetical protein
MSIILDGTDGITTPSVTYEGDATINGLTVGRGAGDVATNTAVGTQALASNTTASNNTAVGYRAGYSNTTGTGNTSVGRQSLYNTTTAQLLTGIGAYSAYSNLTGEGLVAIGYESLYSNTTGNSNIAIGGYSLYGSVPAAMNANTTGSFNVAIGTGALKSNTTASNNTAVGYFAGYSNQTGAVNTYVGYRAGVSATGSYNTFVGSGATDGAGAAITSGAKNTIIGGYNGNQNGLDFRTSSNNIVLSDGDGNPRCHYNNAGNFWAFNNGGAASSTVFNIYNDNASTPYGHFAHFTAASPNNTTNYFFRAQDSTTSCFTIWSNGTTSGRSDARLKKNIADATPKLNNICQLQVRNYEWIESIEGRKEIGLIAQEVETIFPGLVITRDLEKDGDEYKEVKYSAFVPILIKALQELNAKVDAQAAEIAALKGTA